MIDKKKTAILAVGAVVAAAAAGWLWYQSTHVRIGGQTYPKSGVLDLRGQNISEYEAVTAAMPDRTVLWELPFQGKSYPLDTKTITLTSLTTEEAKELDYLTELTEVQAEGCTDYDALELLAQRHPGCRIFYRVEGISSEDETAAVENITAERLSVLLKRLPKLRDITLTGVLPERGELETVQAAFPQVTVHWTVSLGGQAYDSAAQRIDLRSTTLAKAEIAAAAPYLSTGTVVMLPEAMPEADCRSLAETFPACAFQFQLELLGRTFSTDAEEIDISKEKNVDIPALEQAASYFYRLKKVIMCDCGIDNETMEALNQRHEDVQYVWSFYCGRVPMRSDATYFFPAGCSYSTVRDYDCRNLRYCHDLISIDLGHMWVTNIDWVAQMPKLKYLLIPMTGVVDVTPLTGLQELVFVEAYILELKDYTPFTTCPKLEDLNISCTYGSAEQLMGMTQLRHLYWKDATVANSKESLEKLQKSLPNTEITTYLDHSQGKEWRCLPNYYRMRDSMNAGYFGQNVITMFWSQEEADAILECSANPAKPVEPVLQWAIAHREARKKAEAQTAEKEKGKK